MAIPDFLVQRLVVPNSFQQEENGFSFSLQNSLVDAHIFSMKLSLDGKEVQPENIRVQESENHKFTSEQINKEHPFVFSAGSQATLSVFAIPPKNGKVKMTLGTVEAGEISFSLLVNPKKSNFLGILGRKESPDVVKPTKPLFSPAQWEKAWRDYKEWFDGSLNRNLVFFDNSGGFSLEFLENYPPRMKADAILERQQAYINGMTCQADTFPKWWPNFGPGIAAGFLGSGVQSSPDTAWFTPLPKNELSEINPTFDKNNFWWKRVFDITQKAVKRWGDWVSIGHTDLGGTLDVLASLRGTEALLQDLIDEPDRVEKLVWKIHDLWHLYFEELTKIIMPASKGTSCWGPILFPGRGYLLQSDFSYMISPKMFERFVLPELEASCKKMDFATYHMDGKGQIKHLDMLLGIKQLKGIQWVPGDGNPPAEEWLHVLGKIRKANKLVQVTVSSQGALAITKALGNRGFLFNIIELMHAEDANSFIAQLNSIQT